MPFLLVGGSLDGMLFSGIIMIELSVVVACHVYMSDYATCDNCILLTLISRLDDVFDSTAG